LLTDSELICLAVAQALLQVHSEARWLRFVGQRLGALFPYRPQRPGYNKRLRAALPLIKRVIRDLAEDSDFWFDNSLDRGLDAGAVRDVPAGRATLGCGRMGRIRVLRLALEVLLGASPVPSVRPGRDADPVGAGRPEDRGA